MISKDKREELKVEDSFEKAIAADFEEAGVTVEKEENSLE